MSPSTRSRRPRLLGWSAVPLAALVFASASAAWAVRSRSFPSPPSLPGVEVGTKRWVREGVVPFNVCGSLEDADVLVIGDSRTLYAIDRPVFAEVGPGQVVVVWYGGADLRILLSEAATLGPKRVVVSLAPLSFAPKPNAALQELVKDRAPVFDPDGASEADVAEWIPDARARLLALKLRPTAVDSLLDQLRGDFQRARDDAAMSTRAIDRHLGHRLNLLRYRATYTVSPRRWKTSWLPIHEPAASDRAYRARLRGIGDQRHEEAVRTVEAELVELARTHEVACVRLPISASLRAIEDQALDPARVARIAESVGVPFRDFGTDERTGDGSHLQMRAATEFTRTLGEWLRVDVGWASDG